MDALKVFRILLCDSGAQLVEFALSLPMLLLLTMGIIDFGMAFQRYEVLTNAAREGARVSVVAAPAPVYATAHIQARVAQYLAGSNLPAGSVTTSVGAAEVVQVAANRCISVRPITLTYNHQFLFVGGLMGAMGSNLGTRTLTATASMRSELGAVACPS